MVNGQATVKTYVALAAAGDDEAFAKITRLYTPLTDSIVAKYCRSELFDTQDIEDIRQELAIALYDAVLAYDLSCEKVEFGLYAKICMTNRVISRLRKLEKLKKKEIPFVDEYDVREDGAKQSDGEPSRLVIDRESVDSINGLIDKNLSKFEKSVFGLYISDYSSRDIANILGTSSKSVENAIYRIKRKLRELLG